MSLLNGFSGAAGGPFKALGDMLLNAEIRKAAFGDTDPFKTPSAPATPGLEDVTPPTSPQLPSPPAGVKLGNALDPETVGRAHQVYQGLVARGLDPATAVGFAANAVQESRANPNSGAGDKGAAHGLMMWRDDRLTRYLDKYGALPEKGTLDQHLDYIMHELNGTEAPAWRAIQAAPSDAAARAGAISRFYERPKDTQDEIVRRGYIANQLLGHFARIGGGG